MRNDPPQVRDREIGMSRLESLDLLLEVHLAQRVDLRPPARPCDPLRGFKEDIIGRAEAGDEFADGARAYHVVAEKLVAVFEPLRQGGQIGRRILVKEVDAEPRGQLALVMQSEERQMHRVVVFVCGAIIRSVGSLERTLVKVRGDANAEAVIHRVERAPPPLFGCEKSLPQDEGRAACVLGSHPDRAVRGHRDWRCLAFEEFFTSAVCRGRANESLGNVYRVVRHRLIQLRERRQASRLARGKQMVPMESADRGDPGISWNPLGAGGENLLNVANRIGVFEGRVITGPVPHQHDVVVIVDNTRHNRAPPKIDRTNSRPAPGSGTADCKEAAIPYRYRLRDTVVTVHRMNSAVDQNEFLSRSRAGSPPGLPGGCSRTKRPGEGGCDTRSARAEQLPA